MNELLEIYWSNYKRLLINQSVPNHLVESAYMVHNNLLFKLSRMQYEIEIKKLVEHRNY